MTPRKESQVAPVASAEADLSRPGAPFEALPARFLAVGVAAQKLSLVEHGVVVATFPVSTAARGVGGEAGSLRTPPGWHRIHSKIGAGQPLGEIFESREPTGRVWHGEAR